MKVKSDLLNKSKNFLFHTAKIGMWCAILLLFFTHDCDDPSWSNAGGIDTPIHNLYGKFGAICSDLVLQIFGISIVFFLIFKIIFYIAQINGFLRTQNKKITLLGKTLAFLAMMIIGNAIDFYRLNPTHLSGNGGLVGNFLLNHNPLTEHQTFQTAHIMMIISCALLFRIRLRHLVYCLHALSIPFYLTANFLRLSCKFVLKKTEEAATVNDYEVSEKNESVHEFGTVEKSPSTINIIQNNTNNTINVVNNDVQNVEKALIVKNIPKSPIVSDAQYCKNIVNEPIKSIDAQVTQRIAQPEKNVISAPAQAHLLNIKAAKPKNAEMNHDSHKISPVAPSQSNNSSQIAENNLNKIDLQKANIKHSLLSDSLIQNIISQKKQENHTQQDAINNNECAHEVNFDNNPTKTLNNAPQIAQIEEKKNTKIGDFSEDCLEKKINDEFINNNDENININDHDVMEDDSEDGQNIDNYATTRSIEDLEINNNDTFQADEEDNFSVRTEENITTQSDEILENKDVIEKIEENFSKEEIKNDGTHNVVANNSETTNNDEKDRDQIYDTGEIADECYDDEMFSQDGSVYNSEIVDDEDVEIEKFLLQEEQKEQELKQKEQELKQKEEEEIAQYLAENGDKEEKKAEIDSDFDNYTEDFEQKNDILAVNKAKNIAITKKLIDHDDEPEDDNRFVGYRCKIDFLAHPDITKCKTQDREFYHEKGDKLLEVLNDFKIQGCIVNIHPGPVVDLFEFEPVAGTKSSRVTMSSTDIARSMCALSARISIIQGKNAIGIELPNPDRDTVFLRELLEFIENNDDYQLPIALGKRVDGSIQIVDLTKMPHLLIAGTTGSGKSVAINTMIISLLYKLSPKQCRFIMIDPKMLELSIYNDIPHLLTPVITDPKQAIVTLKWVVKEMEERYQMMTHVNVRNINGYNARIAEERAQGETITIDKRFEQNGEIVNQEIELAELPFIVVIVDEMADLMIVTGKEIEILIQRLAQMARAAGIHIIMATQRPSVDVITGVIKANFPTRISFAVTSKIDSRTILGEQGAEQLLGMGDMLYMPNGGKILRLHGAFVSDDEVKEIVDNLKRDFGKANYIKEIEQIIMNETPASLLERDFDPNEDDDELLLQAMEIIAEDKKTSISYIQRKLRIGYNRAANLIERMEKEGFLSLPDSSGKRQING